jgi:hypothetical protein
MGARGTHNVLFVVTMNGLVDAFDATPVPIRRYGLWT